MNFKNFFIAGLVISLASVVQAGYHPDIVGPQSCLECHESEGKAWQKSHHFETFKELHKRKEAKAIAEKMGVKNIKKEVTCAQCHYTGQKVGDPIAGISCESCHGAAKNWIKVHNDYGGPSVKKEQETAAHKAERIQKAVKGGMIRPENIYDVAKNCYQCHTVPNEKLVEVGGHQAGSDFELVSWSQGEVRHNFLSGAGSNKPASAERKRILYIAGRVLDLEHGLRGVAEVTKASPYAVDMAKRVQRAVGHVKAIKEALNKPELNQIFDIGNGALGQLKPNNKATLVKAADDISSAARKFLAANDGSALGAVDGLIPTSTKGTAVQ